MLKKKIKSQTELKRILEEKTEVVFTNGCFDILHSGHVLYLEKAKEQGKILVVAVNSDRSVEKLKGPTRPINPLKDRMTVIAALGSVDYVTSFDEETPLSLIKMLQPDTLVKGGDWSIDQIVGGAEVLSWGGSVKSLSFIEGKSSTHIINKGSIRKKKK
ncbi:MAG: D-glycero-beta-D-manno-heptose 1-phosphate adenylyltransferase [Bdellovibrionaceae bacterium]|nr:D-glycero-beta-D-manno-heptose 1-phosphate adenylyltransferase [Pseudobdellovibrionaceae bacterium]|tara:strand:+ start:117 stop:593 length:477 start_codon:yes stop_codon:yes gene_type:complete